MAFNSKTHQLIKTAAAVTLAGILTMSTGLLPMALAAEKESSNSSHTPVQVVTGYRASALLDDKGDVWQWGSKFEVKNGNTVIFPGTPTKMEGLSNIIDLSLSNTNAMAVKNDGTVWLWSRYIQNKDETVTSFYDKPVQITRLKNIAKVSNGAGLSAALAKDGKVWVQWIFPTSSNLKETMNVVATAPAPRVIEGLDKVVDISTSNNSEVIILKEDGTVWNWSVTESSLPYLDSLQTIQAIQVSGLSDIVKLAPGTGAIHHLALKKDGTVWAWGSRLKEDVNSSANKPFQIAGLTDVTALSAGRWDNVAAKKDGSVWTWGCKELLRADDACNFKAPIKVEGLSDIVFVAQGEEHNAAIKKDGTLWMWGDNRFGQLGVGLNSEIPIHNPNEKNVDAEQSSSIKVTVNGRPITMTEAPAYIDDANNLTYVPLRFISDALGAKIDWTSNDEPIIATVSQPQPHQVKIKLNEKQATIDGKAVLLDGVAQLSNGHTMVPLRVISEGLGANITWNSILRSVDITLLGAPVPTAAKP
ncbi:stalk domain-containing protein [Paenibacillus sp. N3.4]|uniref:stalk domain-containing protein n=1 Tax=Paenibacillus sp. N3.4 TaxID=2603222 RepID=UPI0011C89AE5|nr:stalk domain-containing protein [Paenibacillus sp. N3.4]TXK84304.1 hypothetical protein FU659_09665 [Paenibacillus sp. N3.4]